MAKKQAEQPEVEQPIATPVVEMPRKLWLVRPISGNAPEREVYADTLEDAIRAYNGDQTSYTRKQLQIEG